MIQKEERQRFVDLYKETSRLILDMEIECLQNNKSLSTREKDVLRSANEFKYAVWEIIVHDINTKDPYND